MSKEKKATKSERTRKYIISAAAELFNQKGYSGTSMQDIMEATSLTKGGLYGNFKSKEEIAIASFEYAVKVVRKEVGRRTKVIENSLDKLKAVVYFYKENLFTPPIEGGCPIQNTAVEADDNNPIMREKAIEAFDYWQERMVFTLEAGKKKKEVKPKVDAKSFAALFISTLEGGIMMSRVYKDEKYFELVCDQLLKMIEEVRI